MSNAFIQNTTLSAIGDAIREKTGNSDLILPSKMPEAIDNIPTNNIGKYIWCEQNISDTVTEDNTSGSYTLTTANRPSSEIEYTNVVSDWIRSNVTTDNGNFRSFYYSNGICVAGGSGLWYSTDGMTWSRSNVTSGTFSSVYYANGLWVAGGPGLWYSTDGMTWTHSNQTSGSFNSVYYGNGIWVAAANSGATGLWYSTDGMTWTQSNVTSGNFRSVYYGNGIWVGASNSIGLWYSTDGMTWTQSNVTSIYFYSVYYANGIWVAGVYNGSKGLYYSTDGMTWTQSNMTSGYFYSVYYANGIWVAGSSGSSGLYYSTDGITWTQSNVTSGNFYSAYYANEIWVACGNNKGLYYSTDGMTWSQSNVTSGIFHSAYYVNGIWITGLYYMLVGEMTFNTETKTWEMSNSTVSTLTNTDNTVPTITVAYVRDLSIPNTWYLATAINSGETSPYEKSITYSKKYIAQLDIGNAKLLVDDDNTKYPKNGWIDNTHYTAFNAIYNISDWK